MNSFETVFSVLREVYLKYLLHINKTNSLDSLLPCFLILPLVLHGYIIKHIMTL